MVKNPLQCEGYHDVAGVTELMIISYMFPITIETLQIKCLLTLPCLEISVGCTHDHMHAALVKEDNFI